MTGAPGGSSGVVASAMAAPSTATTRSAPVAFSLGQISARNAAGPMTSRPSDCGDPIVPALSAPASVARFHVRYRLANVARNAARLVAWSGWAREIAWTRR